MLNIKASFSPLNVGGYLKGKVIRDELKVLVVTDKCRAVFHG